MFGIVREYDSNQNQHCAPPPRIDRGSHQYTSFEAGVRDDVESDSELMPSHGFG